MAKTRVNCPNCRQPIVAEVEQLLDVGKDPGAKQRLLSGAVNFINCPHCGYQGALSTPLVYHDPSKELLLTFVPPEIGLPMHEQERVLGPMITQAVNNLAPEARKAYLFRPQTTLTYQGLIERILEADGITREMIQAQQNRLNLIQNLMAADEPTRKQIAEKEDASIDAEFFALLRRLIDASMMSGDREAAEQLTALQDSLLPVTTFGRELQSQAEEMEAAAATLQANAKNLTREKLLDLLVEAPNETRARALVSLARPGLDYQFFQMLSERIEHAPESERPTLAALRDNLLGWTKEIDQQIEARARQTRKLFDSILASEDVSEAMMQSLGSIDEAFLQELNSALEDARKKGDLEKLGKLQKMVEVIQQASAVPPEIALVEELLEAPDEAGRRKLLQEHEAEITPDFLQTLSNIVSQVQSSGDEELAGRVNDIYRSALRLSMEKNMR